MGLWAEQGGVGQEKIISISKMMGVMVLIFQIRKLKLREVQ